MPRRRPPAFARADERAFTLVELVVVMLIVAILGSIAVLGVRSARRSGELATTKAVANAYADAIDRFARDHRGRYPAAPGSADWPDAEEGPVGSALGTSNRYLRNVPEPVRSGGVHLGGPALPSVAYRQLAGGSGYEILVRVDGAPECAVRGGSSSGASDARSCGKR